MIAVWEEPIITPTIKIESVEAYIQTVQTRMPFRYGSARLVRCPHLYLVARIRDSQGRSARGIAADNLPPRWFDKSPEKSYAQELREQIQVVEWAQEAALEAPASTPFRLWLDFYEAAQHRARAAGLPPLLGGFGPSLMERAMNDAVGHLLQLPFHTLLRSNVLGVEMGLVDQALAGTAPDRVLPDAPIGGVAARHTVGLSDPIRTADIPSGDRLDDGLPQSLEEVIQFYGVRYFKIKTQNRLQEDLDRLTSIAVLLEEALPGTPYHCTVDGNEQYEAFEELLPLLEALDHTPALTRLAHSILFIEQPLARSVALDPSRCQDISRAAERFPIIIDESDDSLEAYRRALHAGYSGTSHKNCKNTFKSLLNLARSQVYQETRGKRILSAEDLTNIGTVALQEDLVALSTLGITHAERNGHHYFRGLSHLGEEEQQLALSANPELYCQGDGYVRLRIAEGQIDCRALHRVEGLGVPTWPDLVRLTPVKEFKPEELVNE